MFVLVRLTQSGPSVQAGSAPTETINCVVTTTTVTNPDGSLKQLTTRKTTRTLMTTTTRTRLLRRIIGPDGSVQEIEVLDAPDASSSGMPSSIPPLIVSPTSCSTTPLGASATNSTEPVRNAPPVDVTAKEGLDDRDVGMEEENDGDTKEDNARAGKEEETEPLARSGQGSRAGGNRQGSAMTSFSGGLKVRETPSTGHSNGLLKGAGSHSTSDRIDRVQRANPPNKRSARRVGKSSEAVETTDEAEKAWPAFGRPKAKQKVITTVKKKVTSSASAAILTGGKVTTLSGSIEYENI
ncbi:unnamed protein product [Protopolystoma xenopodis]|uniref:Uncharacterized protein n=1 Tax=Protopolystoma xenopodis TaxID=117903 RepID=A0A3S4ZM79_9PLAT|nr:unnamed protein product [Protopolystoma xenopodis]